ncbi:hypothetical protein FOZ63_015219 [Perkinsus olseni]|uniref:Uncharacterized protein n=1 Tax=Perkinsus olseni TaxID=32597 RepID=A0A7J6SEF4_PEROL|nr:hypothetical protein FOZ62_023343 [Perkinsus olseni]KAF4741467.1 hypothetical protein FOZ63_015219 [Perkinsus olseni]
MVTASPISYSSLARLKPPSYVRDSDIDRSDLTEVLGAILPRPSAASTCSTSVVGHASPTLVRLSPLPARVRARTFGETLRSLGVNLRSVTVRKSNDSSHSAVYAEVYERSDADIILSRLNKRPYVINLGDEVGPCRICLTVTVLDDYVLSQVLSLSGIVEVIRNI